VNRVRRAGAVSGAAPGLLSGVLALAGCVTPATDLAGYQAKAAMSVQAATSEVQTTRITLEALARHRIFPTSADETISANEQALGGISAAFGAVQPPPAGDAVREDVTGLLADAEDAVEDARIAARRTDAVARADALASIRDVARRLGRADTRLS
jgi:hypothetical protein